MTESIVCPRSGDTATIEYMILRILSPKSVAGLTVRQIRDRIGDVTIDLTSMDLSYLMRSLEKSGLVERTEYRARGCPRYRRVDTNKI